MGYHSHVILNVGNNMGKYSHDIHNIGIRKQAALFSQKNPSYVILGVNSFTKISQLRNSMSQFCPNYWEFSHLIPNWEFRKVSCATNTFLGIRQQNVNIVTKIQTIFLDFFRTFVQVSPLCRLSFVSIDRQQINHKLHCHVFVTNQ